MLVSCRPAPHLPMVMVFLPSKSFPAKPDVVVESRYAPPLETPKSLRGAGLRRAAAFLDFVAGCVQLFRKKQNTGFKKAPLFPEFRADYWRFLQISDPR